MQSKIFIYIYIYIKVTQKSKFTRKKHNNLQNSKTKPPTPLIQYPLAQDKKSGSPN